MFRPIVLRLLFVASTLALAACGNESTAPAPTTDAFTVPGLTAALGAPGSSTVADATSGCTYSPSTGWFDCAPVTRAGLTVTRSFAFYDAAGAPQAAYDAVSTASARSRTRISGSTALGGVTTTVDRQGEQAVHGLAGAETQIQLDGVESGTSVASFTGANGARQISTSTIDSTIGLVVPTPRTRERSWPTSGTIVHLSVVSESGDGVTTHATMSTREALTFNGTGSATLTTTVNGVTRTCTRDLATGRTTCSR